MCGIAGFIGLDDKTLLKRMCDSIRYRGPDDEGIFLDDRVGLGVRRLSIIDLKTGNQPVHNEDETVWLVFNGEIYNYVELREQLLAKNHSFYTESDTEVLVHLYEEYGERMVHWLRGMFAFAIWDCTNKRLLLARDRLGKKPIYYAIINGHFFFASEAKAILQYEEYIRSLNLKAIDYFLTYSYIPSPLTAFQGMSKLPPASLLLYEDGKFEVKNYWNPNFAPIANISVASILQQLDQLMTESVRLRLRSDVPLGAFLSGGIDSSAVVSLASRLTDSPIKTFSIGFEELDYNELPFARDLASSLNADHHEMVLRPDVFRVLPILAWHYDEPFSDSSAIPTYYVSEFTRKFVTVALTGDGGDEIFMGYPWMADAPTTRAKLMKRRLRSLRAESLRRLLFRQQINRKCVKKGPSTVERGYLQRVAKISQSELADAYTENGLANRDLKTTRNYMVQKFRDAENLGTAPDTLSTLDYVTIKTYLPEDILVKVDRASMAVSLEPRCPLLDHVLCEFVASIPSELKMKDGNTKIILRKYLLEKNIVPKQIVDREKMGFGVPLEKWFAHDLKQVLENALLRNASTIRKYIKVSYIRSILSDRSSYASAQKIFALVMFELWYKMFIEEDTSAPPSFDLHHYF